MSAKASLGLATATVIGVNAMIGAGIFTTPAIMASKAGPVGLLVYIGVIAAVWCIAQSLAHVATIITQEGWFYSYGAFLGGHRLGVLAAGAYLVGLLIAMGLLTQMAGSYATIFVPGSP